MQYLFWLPAATFSTRTKAAARRRRPMCYGRVMTTFRERPLTWLFFIALACVNIAALATDYSKAWYGELIAAQAMLSAGWLVLGRAHRLARASVFVSYPLLAAAPDYFGRAGGPFPSLLVWDVVLGVLIFISAGTAIAAFVWLAIISTFDREPREPRKARLQFPVAELFGWMIVVAIASVVIRNASFLYVPRLGFFVLVVAAALEMALFLRGDGISPMRWMDGCMAIAAALAFAAVTPDIGVREAAVCFGTIGLWILVQRLDAQLAPRTFNADGQDGMVKLFDPDSEPRRRGVG